MHKYDNNMNNELEILAPAGNYECLVSAIDNGANAIYLGLDKFSARAKAENFNLSNLKEIVEFAHISNVRIYLAINTLMKDKELDEALLTIKQANKCGIDAIIVQDYGLIAKIRSTMPDIVIHLSTQAGIHNLDGALYAEKLGANRIILSREVLLEDIKKIHDNTNLEIECFVQGALCISFSGNCYFSSLASGYSGNRGKCLQLCRKKYSINNKDGYYLSPKDLQLVDKLQDLIDAGVTSFKIEGRMRRKEYVSESVRLYRKAIDGLDYSIEKDNLLKIFNRGNYCYSHIYEPTNNIIYHKAQNHIGKNIGKVLKIIGNKAILSCKLNKGDGIKFFRNDYEVGHALINNDGTQTTFLGNVKVGDKVNITTDFRLMNTISHRTKKKLHCNIKAICKINHNIEINVVSGENSISYLSDFVVQQASKMPLSTQNIIDSLTKGGELFQIDNVDLEIDNNIFIPKAILNDARRNALNLLKNKILSQYENNKIKSKDYTILMEFTKKTYFGVMVQIDNLSNIDEECYNLLDYIAYAPVDWNVANDDIDQYYVKFNKEIILVLPNIARGIDINIIKKVLTNSHIKTVIANNIYAMNLCKDKHIIGGIFLNLINHTIQGEKIMSLEYEINQNEDNFVYIFGKAPLMSFCHCANKTLNGSCLNCHGYNFDLVDERNNSFNIYHYKIGYCYSQLLNSVPIDATKKIKNLNLSKKFVDLVGYPQNSWYNILSSIKNNEPTGIKNITYGYFGKILQ